MSHVHSMPAASARRVTGGFVLKLLLAFFGVIASVDAVMIYAAVSTFRGEETSQAYEKGLAYNLDIAGARAQSARDWRVEATILRRSGTASGLTVLFRDAEGAPLEGLSVAAAFRTPVDGKKDARVTLVETAPGRYEAPLVMAPGWRELALTAERDARELFRSKNRLPIE
jgi:nitrogen fixation protein FixH